MTNKIKKTDKNLALISAILGGASLIYSIFTGLPAIILGVMAIRRKSGNQTQAKIGIAFGIIGCLLIIPIVWLVVHFTKTPFKQQFGVGNLDYNNFKLTSQRLREYKKANGHYPNCTSEDMPNKCLEWQKFLLAYPDVVNYNTEFESDPNSVESRPAGTLVYATKTTCFINVPADPRYTEDNKNIKTERFAALIYFHENGRSCYPVESI